MKIKFGITAIVIFFLLYYLWQFVPINATGREFGFNLNYILYYIDEHMTLLFLGVIAVSITSLLYPLTWIMRKIFKKDIRVDEEDI